MLTNHGGPKKDRGKQVIDAMETIEKGQLALIKAAKERLRHGYQLIDKRRL